MVEKLLLALKKHFSKDKKYYIILDEIFGIYPNNIELYKLALIHRSASLYFDDGTPINNERLEFLGDAILESIVSDYLFIEFPDKSEGFLTQMRSKIVSRATLNEIGLNIGLDEFLIVQYSTNHLQKHLYGDALEAMVGAIYLDKGYDFTNRLIINDILKRFLNLHKMTQVETDFKSRLIEWCQKHKNEVLFDTKQSDNQNEGFNCIITIDNQSVGYGNGMSKKEAEQMAAHEAMSYLKKKREISKEESQE